MRAQSQLIEFLKEREGFKPFASACVSGDLYEDGPFEGTPVQDFGYGCKYWEDGTPVYPGDEIDSYNAEILMCTRIENEFEPAVQRLFPDRHLSPGEWDALVSFVYNVGEAKARRYPLRKAINAGKSGEALARQWVLYCNPEKPSIREGLYRSRAAEMLMWFGLPYQAGLKCKYREDVWDIINTERRKLGIPEVPALTVEPPKPKPEPVLSAPTLKPEPKPMPRTITLPDEWDKMTAAQQTAWLNTGEFIALGGKVGEPIKAAPLPDAAKAPLTVTKKVIETPKLVDASRPKPMETSQTFKGLSKQDSGRETALIGGGLATVTMAAPAAKELTGFFKAYDMQTILIAGGTFAGILLIIGGWRWWAGRMIAYEGRQKAEQPKA